MTRSILCFDIGGTSIRAALAVDGNQPGTVTRYETPARNRQAFITRLADIARAIPERPDAIAISLAGVVDANTGTLIVANIPAIHGTALKDDLQQETGIPVIIANDADCFAVAEAVFGAGKGHELVFGVIFGTGVGGGLVSGGRLFNKAGGFAGEWGHGPIVPLRAGETEIPPFACGCGLSGCVDTIAGARGLERLHAYLHDDNSDAPDILANWHAGAAKAPRTIEVYLKLVAGPLAMAINLTGATIVPAGGGLANDHELIAALDEAVRPLTLAKPLRPLVVPASSGSEPGLTGAAAIGFQAIYSS